MTFWLKYRMLITFTAMIALALLTFIPNWERHDDFLRTLFLGGAACLFIWLVVMFYEKQDMNTAVRTEKAYKHARNGPGLNIVSTRQDIPSYLRKQKDPKNWLCIEEPLLALRLGPNRKV